MRAWALGLSAAMCVAAAFAGCSSSSSKGGGGSPDGGGSSSSGGGSSSGGSSSGSSSGGASSSGGSSSGSGDAGSCPQGPPLADFQTQSSWECANQNCCAQFTTCAGSTDCAAVYSCFNTCLQGSGGKDPGGCETSCEGDASASASSTFNAGVTCVQTHCDTSDGGGD